MIAPTLAPILILLFLFIPIYAQTREEAAALFPVVIFSIPFMQIDTRIAGISLFDLSTWSAAGIGFLVATFVKPRLAMSSPFGASIAIAIALCFLALTAPGIHGANFTSTIRGLLNASLFFVLPLIAFSRSLSRQASLHVLVSVALICFCQAILGLVASKLNWPIYDAMPVKFDVGNWGVKMRGGMLRVGGVMLDSTYFSILLAMGVTAVLALKSTFKNAAAYYIALFGMALGLIATTARGGVLAAGVAFVVMPLATTQKAAAGVRLTLAAVAFVALTVAAQASSVAANLTGNTTDTAGTADYRRKLLDRGIEEIQRHPWTGLDSATVNIVMNDLRQGEHIIDFVNGYIMAGVFGGVGMIIALIAAFLIPIFVILRRASSLNKDQQQVAQFCLGVHCSTIVSCFTTGFTGHVVMPYFLALALTGSLMKFKSVADLKRYRANYRLAVQ